MSKEPGTTPPPGSDHPAAAPSDSAHTESSVVVVAPKIRQPLNPAYAILFGALVTAASGITAAVLSIRSSERLSNQQDKTSAAVQANQELQRKVDMLDRSLEAATARLAALSSTTIPATAPPGPLPSIVVVLPTADPALGTAPTLAPATVVVTSAPAATTAVAAPSTIKTTSIAATVPVTTTTAVGAPITAPPSSAGGALPLTPATTTSTTTTTTPVGLGAASTTATTTTTHA